MIDLNNKSILVTGATGYLGKAISKGLGALGAHVYVNGRGRSTVDALVVELKNENFNVSPAVFDITNKKQAEQWLVSSDIKALSGIVHNAYAGGAGSIESSVEDSFIQSYSVGLISVNELTKLLLPLLREGVRMHGDASVVSISSMYGKVSPDLSVYDDKKVANPPFYGAAKAAIIQWSKYAACEFGGEGIRFNSVSPGPFPNTDVQGSNPDFIKSLSKKVPLGRIGQAEEVGGPVAFLLSSMASFITGSDISVDGGWTAW